MVIAVVVLSIFCAFLGAAVFLCMRRIAALVQHVENLSEHVERALDVLEEAYANIVRSAGQDLISDDIFVRRVVASIMAAKKAVHGVAVLLASFDESAVEHAEVLRDRESNE